MNGFLNADVKSYGNNPFLDTWYDKPPDETDQEFDDPFFEMLMNKQINPFQPPDNSPNSQQLPNRYSVNFNQPPKQYFLGLPTLQLPQQNNSFSQKINQTMARYEKQVSLITEQDDLKQITGEAINTINEIFIKESKRLSSAFEYNQNLTEMTWRYFEDSQITSLQDAAAERERAIINISLIHNDKLVDLFQKCLKEIENTINYCQDDKRMTKYLTRAAQQLDEHKNCILYPPEGKSSELEEFAKEISKMLDECFLKVYLQKSLLCTEDLQ